MTPEYDQNIDRMIYLLATKAAGELNAEELSELEAWKDIAPINRETADEVSVHGFTADLLNNWKQEKADHSLGRVKQQIKRKNLRVLWPRIAAAAAILLVVGAGVFFYTQRHLEGSAATRDLLANDIKPGGNKAYLILSNGKRLSLSDVANGELAKEAGVEITKTADGQVIYTTRHPEGGTTEGPVSGSGDLSSPGFPRHDGGRVGMTGVALNTIETPRGGQYQIRLPDGSKVWLNAASKLIYPVSFNGRGQRVVELSGEAYFEIFKNKLQPFVVKSKNQEVTVLGTHFNINSYTDEPGTKTTLLEGSVSIRHLEGSAATRDLSYRRDDARGQDGVVIKPGEQALLTNNKLKVFTVDADEAIAWKNGLFAYKNTPLQNVMRQIARWYDVDIIYQNNDLPQKLLSGSVSRYDQVSGILKAIESTGTARFKIEGRKITVLP
nr:FecR domain-containing protein [Pedobacter sp. ASV19]